MSPVQFEEMLYCTAVRHCDELRDKKYRDLSLNEVSDGGDFVNVYIPDLRSMLCDIYEIAYEEGYNKVIEEVNADERVS